MAVGIVAEDLKKKNLPPLPPVPTPIVDLPAFSTYCRVQICWNVINGW